MSTHVFTKIMICVIAMCLVLTLAHVIYAVYAYQHCSIIQFIAKELW